MIFCEKIFSIHIDLSICWCFYRGSHQLSLLHEYTGRGQFSYDRSTWFLFKLRIRWFQRWMLLWWGQSYAYFYRPESRRKNFIEFILYVCSRCALRYAEYTTYKWNIIGISFPFLVLSSRFGQASSVHSQLYMVDLIQGWDFSLFSFWF